MCELRGADASNTEKEFRPDVDSHVGVWAGRYSRRTMQAFGVPLDWSEEGTPLPSGSCTG